MSEIQFEISGDEFKVKEKQFTALPPADGLCPVCAVRHQEVEPHNKDSLYYQVSFYLKNKRYPTWADAMEHCSEHIQKAWTDALNEKGIEV